MSTLEPAVIAVSRSETHSFSKLNRESIRLVEGEGIEGDAHRGKDVQHVSRTAKEPAAPNLRQVHLMHTELHDEVAEYGYEVAPGELGENVTTRGIDLLGLPTGTRLRLGVDAVVEVTGLRTPCSQIDNLKPGLVKHLLIRLEDGSLVRKAGVMGVVIAGGEVRPGDPIRIELPATPHLPLQPV
ncbi:MAG TPA: MOSC domain-containing protein [Fimbriimonadaceae bacterium]|nr:MOSC domain-containing protein [Fimbriimonadaceae bacterium]